jgi:hypothetical protein
MKRTCLVCGSLITTGSRCPAHPLVRIRHRPGLRAAHAKARAQLAPLVEAGGADCSRCGQPILQGQPWDADRRPNGFEPSHASHAIEAREVDVDRRTRLESLGRRTGDPLHRPHFFTRRLHDGASRKVRQLARVYPSHRPPFLSPDPVNPRSTT